MEGWKDTYGRTRRTCGNRVALHPNTGRWHSRGATQGTYPHNVGARTHHNTRHPIRVETANIALSPNTGIDRADTYA
eukprot:1129056-Alexandrium_andersonii.AAC.1